MFIVIVIAVGLFSLDFWRGHVWNEAELRQCVFRQVETGVEPTEENLRRCENGEIVGWSYSETREVVNSQEDKPNVLVSAYLNNGAYLLLAGVLIASAVYFTNYPSVWLVRLIALGAAWHLVALGLLTADSDGLSSWALGAWVTSAGYLALLGMCGLDFLHLIKISENEGELTAA